jgi:hypothetical protein
MQPINFTNPQDTPRCTSKLNNTNDDLNNSLKYECLNQLNKSNINDSLLINDVLKQDITIDSKTVDIACATEHIGTNITTDIRAQFPLFFIDDHTIKIPSKIEYVLKKYTSKILLKEINPDIAVAVELCLLFSTQLVSTYFQGLKDPSYKGWKSLRAEYLRDFLNTSPMTYKRIITALEQVNSKGAIIECDYNCIIGEKNYNYRLGQAFIGKGIVSYQLKTNVAKNLLNKHRVRVLRKSETNPIVKNLLSFYNHITLPTIDQIKEEGDKLIALKTKTKKGKLIKKLGKHNRSYFKDSQKYSFVEDSIEIFKYLTDNGLMIPEVGNEKNGGRIVDSFALMPSWIRRMIEIKGKTHIECDYSCLHPNIAIKLYGGSLEYLTHSNLALVLDTDINLVKIEHLSFFNKNVWQMKESPLYKYYEVQESIMLKNIIAEKYANEFKHKITSRRLFSMEVKVMTEVIVRLNKEGIYVGYVYDALLCHPNDAIRVKEVMDCVILELDIKTTAKLSKYTCATQLDETEIESNILVKEDLIKIDAKLINFSDRIKAMLRETESNGKALNFLDAIIVYSDDDVVADRALMIYDEFNPQCKYVVESYYLN